MNIMNNMEYIVVDTFNTIFNIVTDEDGNTLIFRSLKEAEECIDELQCGYIVPLYNTMKLLQRIRTEPAISPTINNDLKRILNENN